MSDLSIKRTQAAVIFRLTCQVRFTETYFASSYKGLYWIFNGCGQVWLCWKYVGDFYGFSVRSPRFSHNVQLEDVPKELAAFCCHCKRAKIKGHLVVKHKIITFVWLEGSFGNPRRMQDGWHEAAIGSWLHELACGT